MRKALDTLGNTVSRADEGYHYWSAGFNISGSEKGCFPYIVNGQTYYFDISLTDLPSPPGEGEGFYDGDIQPLGQNLLEMPLWLWELNHPRGH